MARHIENLQNMGQTVVVTLNRFGTDTQETIDELKAYCLVRRKVYAQLVAISL